jgi:inhibitor of KinA
LKTYRLTYKQYGKFSILIEWPARIHTEILHNILGFKRRITSLTQQDIRSVNHAYQSVLVTYEKPIFDFDKQISILQESYEALEISNISHFKQWTIPVCYDEEFGSDLQSLSIYLNLSKEEIIKLHSETVYTVYFIGFLPGFLYLGGLNTKLNIARKDAPKLNVPKGSVGIGGSQTGIYPKESPGGWYIIGNSPITFFDASKIEPCFAKSGDTIQFESISIEKYREISRSSEKGNYQILNKIIND